MPTLSDIVNVQITANTRTPTRKGFGTPAILAYHTKNLDAIRTYTDLSGLTSDGFEAYHPVYRIATALLAQDPRVEQIKVIRVGTAPTYTAELTVQTAVEGAVISFDLISAAGVTTSITRTVPASSTTTAEATAIELLVEAASGINSTASGAVVTVTSDIAGGIFYVTNLKNIGFKDVTTPSGTEYSDALSAAEAVDDDFYFVVSDVNSLGSGKVVPQIATWVSTRTKLYFCQSMDTAEIGTNPPGFGALFSAAHERVAGIWTKHLVDYASAAWVGKFGPKNPGSITGKFKELTGVTAAVLSATNETNLKGVKANYYVRVAGLNITTEGTLFSGQFIDVRHGIDWLIAQIQERVFGILANADKIPYTDPSVELIKGEIFSTLSLAIDRSFIAASPAPTVTAPLVANVAVLDRAARLLPDVKFTATLAGAVHKVKISGTLSV